MLKLIIISSYCRSTNKYWLINAFLYGIFEHCLRSVVVAWEELCTIIKVRHNTVYISKHCQLSHLMVPFPFVGQNNFSGHTRLFVLNRNMIISILFCDLNFYDAHAFGFLKGQK